MKTNILFTQASPRIDTDWETAINDFNAPTNHLPPPDGLLHIKLFDFNGDIMLSLPTTYSFYEQDDFTVVFDVKVLVGLYTTFAGTKSHIQLSHLLGFKDLGQRTPVQIKLRFEVKNLESKQRICNTSCILPKHFVEVWFNTLLNSADPSRPLSAVPMTRLSKSIPFHSNWECKRTA